MLKLSMVSIDKDYYEIYEIQKSKFLAFAFSVSNEDAIKETLASMRAKYKDATHVCFAYILNSPKIERASDDNEPSGTAGKPLLELLKKKGLEQVLLVVVRYFGGIKLGTGGLLRAYTTAGNMVLSKAKIVEKKTINKYIASIDLDMGSKLKSTINLLGGEVLNSKFNDKAYIEFSGEIERDLKAIFPQINIETSGSIDICL